MGAERVSERGLTLKTHSFRLNGLLPNLFLWLSSLYVAMTYVSFASLGYSLGQIVRYS